MTKLHELNELGQSIWLDYIRRSFLDAGELQRWIDMGLRGVTSNPSIFEKAIAGSQDYQEDLRQLAQEGRSADQIFAELAASDIRQAADLLRPVYEESRGTDGFVSLEVNPALAYDTQASLDEARRLWSAVDRPNLMVKIPATEQGIPAIAQAISEGININITLIFSRSRYGEVISAYLQGLEQRLSLGLPVRQIASVASFFVSRVDTKVDKQLESILQQEGPGADLAARLLGKAGVANARLAYRQFKEVFEGERFARLKADGAQVQRPLWASTSTKNPAYADIKYVQELIGPQTVNTLPQETLEAFLDHGEVRLTIDEDLDGLQRAVQSLEDLGISLEQVTQELEQEGVAAFAKSYEALMETIQNKREGLQAGQGRSSSPHAPGGAAPS